MITGYWVMCEKCHTCPGGCGPDAGVAIALWNRRADLSPLAPVADALVVDASKNGCGLPCGYDCNGACFATADLAPVADAELEALVARLIEVAEEQEYLLSDEERDGIPFERQAADAITALRARTAQPVGVRVKPGEEWHEDMGYKVWWRWEGDRWAGEPAWIGSPNCDDWPGYHTHFSDHPDMPALLPEGGA